MIRKKDVTRRDFLKRSLIGATGVVGFPYIVRSSALGLDGAVPPSERITMGCIGLGGMGQNDMKAFMNQPDLQVVAVCDVDRNHLKEAQAIVDKFYDKKGNSAKCCDAYPDFRHVLARQDIDTVQISTPDQWHVPLSIMAAQAGKDIYCEKPATRFVAEGRVLCDTIKRLGRIYQTGTQLRSWHLCRFACELVRNGRIGKLHTIRTYLPQGPSIGIQPEMPVPPHFDYDMWLGPAPWAPYTKNRCHFNFRYLADYAGGAMTDLGAHDNDIAQWGNGTELTGPVEVQGKGEFPKEGLYDTAMKINVQYTYANGVKLICSTVKGRATTGTRFEGNEGWIFVRFGIDAEPKSILKSKIGPNEIHLYESKDHQRNFLDGIKTRKETICPPEIGHRSVTVCHIGNIAMILGRKLRWDPGHERFVGDDEANRMLTRPMRSPWQI